MCEQEGCVQLYCLCVQLQGCCNVGIIYDVVGGDYWQLVLCGQQVYQGEGVDFFIFVFIKDVVMVVGFNVLCDDGIQFGCFDLVCFVQIGGSGYQEYIGIFQ